ncbi:MAG: tRNA (cytidine(34)-2'-O)-methyltransferase [Rhabdochlamydiaceae bacterium]
MESKQPNRGIVLFQPEIPQNTGNIVRTCSVTNTDLYLVRPLGFSTSNKMLRRAGLDYWEGVNVHFIDDIDSFLLSSTRPFYFFSSHAKKPYTDISYTEQDLFIFGSETKGLPVHLLEKYPEKFYTIPMKADARCLNLANSVAIVLYESLRQRSFQF